MLLILKIPLANSTDFMERAMLSACFTYLGKKGLVWAASIAGVPWPIAWPVIVIKVISTIIL